MACCQFRSDSCVTYIRVRDDGDTYLIEAPPTTISAPGDLGHSEAAYAFDSDEFDVSW
jgi:hypothetical protein